MAVRLNEELKTMKETIGHCPYCTKMIFKDASFKDEADFETNCHHCGKPIMVHVEKEIIIVVRPIIKMDIPKGDGNRVEKPI